MWDSFLGQRLVPEKEIRSKMENAKAEIADAETQPASIVKQEETPTPKADHCEAS